jgi:hypothetical protein
MGCLLHDGDGRTVPLAAPMIVTGDRSPGHLQPATAATVIWPPSHRRCGPDCLLLAECS